MVTIRGARQPVSSPFVLAAQLLAPFLASPLPTCHLYRREQGLFARRPAFAIVSGEVGDAGFGAGHITEAEVTGYGDSGLR